MVRSAGASLLRWRGSTRHEDVDLADVLGMDDARYALEVAAAGGHHLMLSGPKGAGKTTLAERIPTILPDLSPEESLELTAIHSLAGVLDPGAGMIMRPPYSAPHHDASKTSIVGGGSGQVRPGELSRTHAGVLLLDEFPLFRRDVIEALREPLENGEITVARAEELVTLPARTILVVAANPCPCGEHRPDVGKDTCRCKPVALREYRARGLSEIAVYKTWVAENILTSNSDGDADTLIFLPLGTTDPEYRDVQNKCVTTHPVPVVHNTN